MNPFNLMPTSQPDKFPGLFSSAPAQAKTPVFRRPGVFNTIAKDAYEVVSFLNLLGFRFTIPKFVDKSTMEGNFKDADINDPTPREYVAGHVGFTGELNIAQIVDNLGGDRSSPQRGLLQTMDSVGVKYSDLKTWPSDQQIVDALEQIFRS
jgi:hypothetical protein